MVFQDTTEQDACTEPLQHIDDTFRVQDSTDSSLADYLGRPVLIYTHSWDVGSQISFDISPWSLFYNNSRVQKKVEGFFLQRFDLKIKILINGSPFYYGKCLASYNPLGEHDAIENLSNISSYKLITRSQRNSIVLDANTSVGGVISCPYFHPNAYQEVTYAFDKMGLLGLDSYTPLGSSNGSASAVFIHVYAWAENVVMSIPTTQAHIAPLSLESHSDEYSKNMTKARKPSAAVSFDSIMTKTVPKITKYAVATKAFVEAVEGLSLMFGFSRPPVLEKELFVKNTIIGNLANGDVAECVHKLTLDSKQELTIDPRTVGIEPIDELQLQNIINRESYVTQFPWDSSSSYGTLLWSSRVTPMQYAIEYINPGISRFTPTLLAYVAQLFEYWSGDMEYRFSVVASTYHKGRLLIVYDPSPPANSTMPASNSVYSRVIDISEVKDFVVKVGYAQNVPYLKCVNFRDLANTVGVTVSGQTYTNGFFPLHGNEQIGANGTISVYVLNPLINPSPTDTGNPVVLVHTKACSNMRFAGLQSLRNDLVGTVLPNVAPLSLDSHSDESPDVVLDSKTIGSPQNPDKFPLVFFGETFTSLRSVLRRYNYYLSYVPTISPVWGTDAVANAQSIVWNMIRSNIPQYPGFDDGGYAGTLLDKHYPGKLTALTYIMPMFVGLRGGIRYKYILSSSSTASLSGTLTVTRRPYDGDVSYDSTITNVATAGIIDLKTRQGILPDTAAGATATQVIMQPCVEVELPYYAPNRFSYIRGNTGNDPMVNPAFSALNTLQGHSVTATISGGAAPLAILDSHISVGEDFQLFWLLSAPPVYLGWAGD